MGIPQFGDNAPQDLSGIPADDAMVQLQLKRKLAMADALRQQEMPQGQMVSGHYVAPSWTQALAGLANKYVAGQQEQDAMKQYGQAQQAKSAKLGALLSDLQKGKETITTDNTPYQIQVPNGQATPTDNMGGMQPYNNGMKSIDVPNTVKTSTYNPYSEQEYMTKIGAVMPDMLPKMLETQFAKKSQQDALQAQHEYDMLIHKRDRGEKLTDTQNANLFALDKLLQEQGFTANQNNLNRGVTMRGQNMTNANQPPIAVIGQNGQPIYVPRNQAIGQSPYNQNQAKMTEDQGKASGWLNQATNAYGNMQKVMYKSNDAGQPLLDINGKPQLNLSVIQPSTKEALANQFGVAGAVQKAPRQQFVQAASSMSEALLRAATGAGVNESEAKQKINELTPQYFDKPEVIQQKLDAIPVYLESLKMRAGGVNSNQIQIHGTYNPATERIE